MYESSYYPITCRKGQMYYLHKMITWLSLWASKDNRKLVNCQYEMFVAVMTQVQLTTCCLCYGDNYTGSCLLHLATSQDTVTASCSFLLPLICAGRGFQTALFSASHVFHLHIFKCWCPSTNFHSTFTKPNRVFLCLLETILLPNILPYQ